MRRRDCIHNPVVCHPVVLLLARLALHTLTSVIGAGLLQTEGLEASTSSEEFDISAAIELVGSYNRGSELVSEVLMASRYRLATWGPPEFTRILQALAQVKVKTPDAWMTDYLQVSSSCHTY